MKGLLKDSNGISVIRMNPIQEQGFDPVLGWVVSGYGLVGGAYMEADGAFRYAKWTPPPAPNAGQRETVVHATQVSWRSLCTARPVPRPPLQRLPQRVAAKP